MDRTHDFPLYPRARREAVDKLISCPPARERGPRAAHLLSKSNRTAMRSPQGRPSCQRLPSGSAGAGNEVFARSQLQDQWPAMLIAERIVVGRIDGLELLVETAAAVSVPHPEVARVAGPQDVRLAIAVVIGECDGPIGVHDRKPVPGGHLRSVHQPIGELARGLVVPEDVRLS